MHAFRDLSSRSIYMLSDCWGQVGLSGVGGLASALSDHSTGTV